MAHINTDTLFRYLMIQEERIESSEAIIQDKDAEIKNLQDKLTTAEEERKTAARELTTYQFRKQTVSLLTVVALIRETFYSCLISEFAVYSQFMETAFDIRIQCPETHSFSEVCDSVQIILEQNDWTAFAKICFDFAREDNTITMSEKATHISITIPYDVINHLAMFQKELSDYVDVMKKFPDNQEEYLQYYRLRKKFGKD